MAAKQIILILGAGPRVGTSVAQTFATNGYQVALASRKGTGSKTTEGYLSLKADFADPGSVVDAFKKVNSELGAFPNVVVYNAAALTPPPDQGGPLSIPASSIDADINVNTIGAYVAAQEAVKGWATLPADIKKTFIYTGNIANRMILPVPLMLSLGIGKSASSYVIGYADSMYRKAGYRFFYADERKDDGSLKGMELDGPAHADFYADLVEHKGDIPWNATFVKGKGYVHFP